MKNNGIFLASYHKYKNHFQDFLGITIAFILICLPSLVLCAFFPGFLIFVVPFLIIPLFFAYCLSINDGHKNGDFSNKRMVAYFFSYFRMPFYGSYRVVRNFFLAILLALIAEIIVYLGVGNIWASQDLLLYESLNVFSGYLAKGDYAAATSYMSTSPSINSFFSVIYLATYVVFAVIFVFRTSYCYALNPFFRFFSPTLSLPISNGIYVGGMKKARSEYFKDYFSCFWPMLTVGTIFFAFGIFLARAYWDSFFSEAGAVVLGLTFGLLGITPFLPFYACCLGAMMEKYMGYFLSYSVEMAERKLKEIKNKENFDEEEISTFEKALNDSKKMLKDGTDKKDEDEEK